MACVDSFEHHVKTRVSAVEHLGQVELAACLIGGVFHEKVVELNEEWIGR